MNTETDKILERIRIVFCIQSDSDLAKTLNVAKTTISTWRQRDSTPYSLCVQIAKDKNISLDWLLTGDGEMLKGKQAEQEWGGIEERRGMYKAPLKIENMLEGLTERQKMLVLADIEEKKQLNEMKAMFAQLQGVKEGK